ncbi:MAG: glutathione S-transferase family protein [Parvibaculaceae bacterium]|nr:glutathione S-transferase family protein [Parvibaculaceae bacterium]
MGHLANGKWLDEWYDTQSTGGKFARTQAQFRNWVTTDGSPGPTGSGGFAPESGRYHLYISHACPWANRTAIFRTLKGLESHIGVSVVDAYMGAEGWTFGQETDSEPDALLGKTRAYEIYLEADPTYTGRVTVPILWDKHLRTIVSNESADIIRMFNTAFNGLDGVKTGLDFYPAELADEINAINEPIYNDINNGVYTAGFATSKEAYEEAVTALFERLDWVEEKLEAQPYLLGDRLTEADWRLFTTLIRFDPVYVGHFKCNIRRIADYKNLYAYMKKLYQHLGVANTINFDHIKRHYYTSHTTINPTGIVPKGPDLSDLER